MIKRAPQVQVTFVGGPWHTRSLWLPRDLVEHRVWAEGFGADRQIYEDRWWGSSPGVGNEKVYSSVVYAPVGMPAEQFHELLKSMKYRTFG